MPQKIRAQMSHARHVIRFSLCAFAMAACAGCGDESADGAKRDDRGAVSLPVGDAAWLGLADDTLPEEWLVRRKTTVGAGIDPRVVETARTLLDEASRRFGDQSRMIANRAAQLEGMLAGKGHHEDALDLIEMLMRVAPGSRPTGGFASICQYYFNLRVQGLDREQALDALSKRYGSGT